MNDNLKRHYRLCEELGRGRFGVVYHCYSVAGDDSEVDDGGESYACKSIYKHSIASDAIDRHCLDSEAKILHLLSGCPNILRLRDVYEDDDYVHIVTDFCGGGDLYGRVSSGVRFSEPDAARVLVQLMAAVAFCHRSGVAHRDIKPDNIMFDLRGKLKLGDFGSAEMFNVSDMNGLVGTPYYVAPEVLMGTDYDEKVDVWSAGVILYIMLGGAPPFLGDGPAETFAAVLRGNLRFPMKMFRSVSPEAKDLLRKMICRVPFRRLSAEQVLRHPWMINGGEASSKVEEEE